MPNVDDHGLEVLKKAARNLSPTPKKDYAIQNLLVSEDGVHVARVTTEKKLAVETVSTQSVYATLSFLNGTSSNLAVNGSVTPVVFTAQPQPTQIVFLESIQMLIADDKAFSINGFGGIPALTNGVLIEYQSKGILYNLKTLFNNADIFSFFTANPPFIDRTILGASDSFYAGDWEIQHRIVIDPAFNDFVRITVRDNLSGLANFSVHAKTFKELVT